jgi:hypothetical protein
MTMPPKQLLPPLTGATLKDEPYALMKPESEKSAVVVAGAVVGVAALTAVVAAAIAAAGATVAVAGAAMVTEAVTGAAAVIVAVVDAVTAVDAINGNFPNSV